MKRSILVQTVAILGILLISVAALAKEVKVKPFDAQATLTFVNAETEGAHGLVVELSAAGEVKKDDDGNAGPFRNISGNGGTKITMSNPGAPIAPGGDGLEMTFQSYKSKLKITKWWWTNAKGKPLGKKKNGPK